MNRKSEPCLTARQQRAAILLAEGKTTGSIAEELGIHRSTLNNWKNRPEFEAFVNARKEDMWALFTPTSSGSRERL